MNNQSSPSFDVVYKDWTNGSSSPIYELELGAVYHYFNDSVTKLKEENGSLKVWLDLMTEYCHPKSIRILHKTKAYPFSSWEGLLESSDMMIAEMDNFTKFMSDHYPTVLDKTIRWHMCSNLKWLAEQDHRPPFMPCGDLTGSFLYKVAEALYKRS
jgi:hypothetical protein